MTQLISTETNSRCDVCVFIALKEEFAEFETVLGSSATKLSKPVGYEVFHRFQLPLSPPGPVRECVVAIAAQMGGERASRVAERMLEMLRSYRDHLSRAVIHCFTGDRRMLYSYLDLDCHIGITGWICDERRGTHMKEYMADIPSDRLMIETDAPYLKPRNLRPKIKSHRNEPRLLPWILGTLAACRHEHPAALAETTTRTARAFFRI